MVTILACMIFAALSGPGPATTAAIGSIMIPGMIAAGYRKDDAAAVSATGGTLGILIPPSNPMIIYASSPIHPSRRCLPPGSCRASCSGS